MSKIKYIGNVFTSTKLGKDGSRTILEGELNLKVNVDEVTLKRGDYINFRTPEVHYGGLLSRGVITQEQADEGIQRSKASNVRLIPTLNAKTLGLDVPKQNGDF